MTFKGATYSSIIDLERLIIVWEANLKACQIELKYYTLMRDKDLISEINTKILLYQKGLEELKKLEVDLIDKMDSLSHDMNDLVSRIFVLKFVKGKENAEIMEELNISISYLFKCYNIIDKMLEETQYGKQIKQSLQE